MPQAARKQKPSRNSLTCLALFLCIISRVPVQRNAGGAKFIAHHLGSPSMTASETPESAPYPPGTSSPPLIWSLDDLARVPTRSWLWQGYLAPGLLTLLTGRIGRGLTTLAGLLLSRMDTGGPLAGLTVAPGKAVVITGDSLEQCSRRGRLPGPHVGWICRPFRTPPRPHDWQPLVDQIADYHARSAFSLAVIDPLNAFLPRLGHDPPTTVHATLAALRGLTTLGLSVLALHHPIGGDHPPGQAATDCRPWTSHADIHIEMRRYRRTSQDRCRRLRAWSPYEETPRQRIIDLTADGTQYLVHDGLRQEARATHWATLHAILAGATAPLTRAAIRQRWPQDPVPDDATVYRWLEEAIARGLARKYGRGRRNDPFLYGPRDCLE
jgi:hypothetical protein